MKLELLGLPMAISPLHDKDLSSVEGQLYKKAHYHVLYVAKIQLLQIVFVRKSNNAWVKKCCYGSDSSEYRKHVFVSNA